MGLAVFLLGVAWAGANPPSAAPDEFSHVVKAYATGKGQISGSSFNGALGEKGGLNAAQLKYFRDAGRAYNLPQWFREVPGVPCFAFDRNASAACSDHEKVAASSGPVFTRMGGYPPFMYAPSGLAMQGASSYNSAEWRGRLVNVLLASILLGWAALVVWDRGRAAISLAGLALAVTPMVLFLSASVTTNGIETAAAILAWAALLKLIRAPGGASPTAAWLGLAVGGGVMALSRMLDPGFLVVMVIVVLVAWKPARRALTIVSEAASDRHRSSPRLLGPIVIGILVIASLASILWTELVTAHPPFDLKLATDALSPAISDLPNQLRQVVGIFGWNDTTMPQVMYLLWFALVGAFSLVALRIGSNRERFSLVGLGAVVVLADLGIATLVEAQIGFGMQARYFLPLAVGIPMVAAEVIFRHPDRVKAPTELWLRRGALVGVAVLQLVAFLANAHRYAVGQNASWTPPWGGWSPTGGLALWVVIAVVGAGCLGATAWLTGPGRPDPNGSPTGGSAARAPLAGRTGALDDGLVDLARH